MFEKFADVELDFEQRRRAELLIDDIVDTPSLAAFEIIYLRDKMIKWKEFKPGDELPPMGHYWLILCADESVGYQRHVCIGSVEYSKPKNIFRTEYMGGLREHQVTHYAKFEMPEMPI